MAPAAPVNSTKTAPSEADIATNNALLNYSEASRLAKSWLSGFNSNGQDDTEKDQEAEEQAERELLKKQNFFSDTGGIGYHAPESPSGSRPSAMDSTTTFLRKQLLSGRNAPNGTRGHSATVARPRSIVQRSSKHEHESDEEESRASVGKKRGRTAGKVTKTVAPAPMDQTHGTDLAGTSTTKAPALREAAPPDDDGPEPARLVPPSKAAKKRGTSSYLDEVLALRAAKKQKKRNTNNKPGQRVRQAEGKYLKTVQNQ